MIKPGDMEKMKQSNVLSSDNPQALQRLVWFSITFFLCRRGQEGQQNLTKTSFVFKVDDLGMEYVTMDYKAGLVKKWSKPVLTTKRFKPGLNRAKLGLNRSKLVKTRN